ncbi:hypothetical protein C8Q74DRAFT_1211700, partial [Fomes fomentarius]
ALVLYEHMISAQQEYQVIWRRKFSVPMVLFVVNRYLLVIHSVLFILWYLIIAICVLNGYLPVFTAVRVHAINRRNWYCTSVVLMLGICAIPKNIVSTTQSGYHMGNDLIGVVTLSTRILHRIVQNVVVLGITWYRTYGVVIAAWKAKCATSVVSVMLRDGAQLSRITFALHLNRRSYHTGTMYFLWAEPSI